VEHLHIKLGLKRYKPTSSGRRGEVGLTFDHLTKKKPEKGLVRKLVGNVGRSKGKVSVRHREVGAKKRYRVIDFKRDKKDIPAKVFSIEYDPNRGCDIALVIYKDGEKRFISAPKNLKVGDKIIAGDKVEVKVGNSMLLSSIPLGVPIHNVELRPGKGGQIARGAGNFATITAMEGKYAHVKLPSSEIKKILSECSATIGELGNADLKNIKLSKAGKSRKLGIRPTVRGVAFSGGHPHGGKYKTSGVGRKSPLTPWGKPTKGKKTRKRKYTDKYTIKGRKRGKGSSG